MGVSARPLSVYDLTTYIKRLMEEDDLLTAVSVEGEVSNLVKASSGHAYFTLKDPRATLKAAMWAGTRRRVPIEFKNGDKVIAFGSISLYEPRGEYQLIISDLKPAGLGALYEAFERLKAKLAQEGLFEPDRKTALPFLPKGIGVVTSPKGAVIQDIYRVIRRRFPSMPIYLVPSKVQGEGAAEEVAKGIDRLDKDPRVDVIIIARGGGSLEDLWAFNEETLARAIARAVKPVVSAVGHETDTTIADFVADKRAPTPSVAGELVVPVRDDLKKSLGEARSRLKRGLSNLIAFARERLERARSCRFLKRPELWVSERRLHLANRLQDLDFRFRNFFRKFRHSFDLLLARFKGLNPREVLGRGYIMATDSNGNILMEIKKLALRQKVFLHFADGNAGAVIESLESTHERTKP